MCSQALAGVVEQASALLAPFVDQTADRSLGGDTVGVLAALASLEQQVATLKLKHLAAFDAEDLGLQEGVPNSAQWWALQAGCSLSEARAESFLGRRLFAGDLTATGEALESGRITTGQAEAIHKGTRALLASDVETLEPILLACPMLAPEQLRTVAGHALDRIRSDSDRDEAFERSQAERTVGVHDLGPGNGWHLAGHLDDETGTLMHGLLEGLSKPVKDDVGNRDPRSAGQRRHDAVREICRLAVRSDPHEPSVPAALVTLTVTLDELTAMQAPAAEQPTRVQDLSRQCCDADRTWMLIDPHPERLGLTPHPPPRVGGSVLEERLRVHLVREQPPPRTTGDPDLDTMLRAALMRLAPAFGGIPTDVLNLGRTERLGNRAQRRALGRRHGGCVVAGCPCPANRCRIHHVRWWENGGPTDLDNEVLACDFHHARIHQGWILARRGDGTWALTPPAAERTAA